MNAVRRSEKSLQRSLGSKSMPRMMPRWQMRAPCTRPTPDPGHVHDRHRRVARDRRRPAARVRPPRPDRRGRGPPARPRRREPARAGRRVRVLRAAAGARRRTSGSTRTSTRSTSAGCTGTTARSTSGRRTRRCSSRPDGTELLRAINDRGITRLLVEDGGADPGPAGGRGRGERHGAAAVGVRLLAARAGRSGADVADRRGRHDRGLRRRRPAPAARPRAPARGRGLRRRPRADRRGPAGRCATPSPRRAEPSGTRGPRSSATAGSASRRRSAR